jgi:hypothetical protein
MPTLFLTIFYLVWLVLVLILLGLIWYNGMTRTQVMERALAEATLKAAEAARLSAEAVHALATRSLEKSPNPPPSS